MGYPQTRPQVLRSLTENVGTMMWVEDIAEETRLPVKSVQSAMGAIIRSGQHKIQIHARGNCWTYLGPATKSTDTVATPTVATADAPKTESAYHAALSANATYGRRSFVELSGIKWTEKNAILIVDMEGNLYRATPI